MRYSIFLACAALALCLGAPQSWAAPRQARPAIHQQAAKAKPAAKAVKAKAAAAKAAPAKAAGSSRQASLASKAKAAPAKAARTGTSRKAALLQKPARSADVRSTAQALRRDGHAKKQKAARASFHARQGRHAYAARGHARYHANRHVPAGRHYYGTNAQQTAGIKKEHLRLIPTVKRPRTIYRGSVCPTVISVGEKVTGIASTKLDLAYRAGGTSPVTGFDCSGFVQWVFARHGISLPRSARDQESVGRRVDRNSLQPGDILIFRSPTASSGRHTAIYVGNDQFIHSPRTGKTIRYDKLGDTYWRTHYLTARRVLKAPPCETGSMPSGDRPLFLNGSDPVDY